MQLCKKPASHEFPADEPMLAKWIADEGSLFQHLIANLQNSRIFFEALPEQVLQYRYQENKWTIKEILGHIIDMERIYNYRILRIARNDTTPLPGFNDRHYVYYSGANERSLKNLLDEFTTVRTASIALLEGLPGNSLQRSGFINGQHATAAALAYHMAGHELHHINVIQEKYLSNNNNWRHPFPIKTN